MPISTRITYSLLVVVLPFSLLGYDPHANLTKENKLPKELENIGISNVSGKKLDLGLVFRDESGKEVTLGDYFRDGIPVLLSPVYFKCPTLCNYHMNGVMKAFKNLDWSAGTEFQYIAVSISPTETPEIAAPKKAAYLKDYGRLGADKGFHLLTGNSASIDPLLKQLDFRYRWDEEAKQYIHASGVYVLTPEGTVSRIFQGIQFGDRDLKFAFLEAGEGKIGSFMDKFALFCFQFDPRKNKYTIYAYRIMQMGAGLTLLILGSFLFINWRKITNNRQGVM